MQSMSLERAWHQVCWATRQQVPFPLEGQFSLRKKKNLDWNQVFSTLFPTLKHSFGAQSMFLHPIFHYRVCRRGGWEEWYPRSSNISRQVGRRGLQKTPLLWWAPTVDLSAPSYPLHSPIERHDPTGFYSSLCCHISCCQALLNFHM